MKFVIGIYISQHITFGVNMGIMPVAQDENVGYPMVIEGAQKHAQDGPVKLVLEKGGKELILYVQETVSDEDVKFWPDAKKVGDKWQVWKPVMGTMLQTPHSIDTIQRDARKGLDLNQKINVTVELEKVTGTQEKARH